MPRRGVFRAPARGSTTRRLRHSRAGGSVFCGKTGLAGSRAAFADATSVALRPVPAQRRRPAARRLAECRPGHTFHVVEDPAEEPRSPDERAASHRRAAAAHEAAAARHDAAAKFWAERGDRARAELERRNAAIERDAAALERDRAALAHSGLRRTDDGA